MAYASNLLVDNNTKIICQKVIKIICSNQGPKLLPELIHELNISSGSRYNLSESGLYAILRVFPENIRITNTARGYAVAAITNLGLCDAHCANKASCNNPLCDGLHICKFYLLSNSCRFGQGNRCLYGHDLTTPHNRRLLCLNYIDHLSLPELRHIFAGVENRSTSTLPKICKFYNVMDGCRYSKNGKPCPYMHICKFYLLGSCRFGINCKRNHNVYDPQVKSILTKHGINVQRSPKEVLGELQSTGLGDAGDDVSSNYSAASDRPPLGFHMPGKAKRWGSVPGLNRMTSNLSGVSINDDTSDSDFGVDDVDSSDAEYGATGGHHLVGRQKNKRRNKKSERSESLNICIYNLRNKCAFGQSCRKQHKEMPYQWQFQECGSDLWIEFEQGQNLEIEINYCDVSKELCYVRLRQEVAEINFEKENIHLPNKLPFKIRRLSTASSCIEKYQPLATDWKWYWINQEKKWCQYGEKDQYGATVIDSNDIEQNYLENSTGQMRFATLQFEYILDFQKMEQLNLITKTSRKVRRRPVLVDLKEIEKRKKRSAEIDPRMNRTMSSNMDISCIPAEWNIDRGLSSDQVLDHFQRVKIITSPWHHISTLWVNGREIPYGKELDDVLCPISESDPKTRDEYKKVRDLFGMTMSPGLITSIERIENGELWMNFAGKRDKMKRKKKSEDLNEKRLFHGTYHQYVDAICRQGFDFRFSGKSVGTKYGKGSYFSKSSQYANSYTDKSKEMFVVLVLAGDTVKGDPSYVRPPPKNPRDPHELYDSCVDDVSSPNIFVIFTFDQVYPQYVIKYKGNKISYF